jgi:hypothetical protein
MALVLVRDVAPTEVWQRSIRGDAQRLEWIDAPRPDRTQVLPLVAEVEHVGELLAGLQPTQVHATVIEQVLGVVILVAEDAQAVLLSLAQYGALLAALACAAARSFRGSKGFLFRAPLRSPLSAATSETAGPLPGGTAEHSTTRESVKAVGARELVRVTAVPAGERVIDGCCELSKGVAARGSEGPSRARPDGLTVSRDQVHANREPRPCGNRIGASTRAPRARVQGSLGMMSAICTLRGLKTQSRVGFGEAGLELTNDRAQLAR